MIQPTCVERFAQVSLTRQISTVDAVWPVGTSTFNYYEDTHENNLTAC